MKDEKRAKKGYSLSFLWFIQHPWALHPCLPTYHTLALPWMLGLGSTAVCVCVCVLVRGVPGWHHTVVCREGLLQAHGIYNIYRPPEQMSSLSHSVWLASLHTHTHTESKEVAEKLLTQSVPHPLPWIFSFSSIFPPTTFEDSVS